MISFIFGISIFMIALFIGVSANIEKKSDVQDIFLSNVIALAQNEGGSSDSWVCYSQFDNCPWYQTCSTLWLCGNPCEKSEGKNGTSAGTCYPN